MGGLFVCRVPHQDSPHSRCVSLPQPLGWRPEKDGKARGKDAHILAHGLCLVPMTDRYSEWTLTNLVMTSVPLEVRDGVGWGAWRKV